MLHLEKVVKSQLGFEGQEYPSIKPNLGRNSDKVFFKIDNNPLRKSRNYLIFNKSSLEHLAKFSHILQKASSQFCKFEIFDFNKHYALCQSAIVVVQVSVVALGPLVFVSP